MLMILPRKTENFILLNLTKLDGCELLSNTKQNTIMALFRTSLDRYSNFPDKCPFRRNTLYFIRSYRIDISKFPAFSFETALNIRYESLVDNKVTSEGLIKTLISKKGLRNNFMG